MTLAPPIYLCAARPRPLVPAGTHSLSLCVWMSLALSLSEQCVVHYNGITAIQPAAHSPSLSLLSSHPSLSLSLSLHLCAGRSFTPLSLSLARSVCRFFQLLSSVFFFLEDDRKTDCFLNEVSRPLSLSLSCMMHVSLSLMRLWLTADSR